MTDILLSSNKNDTSLSVPKLRDDGSNWADHKPRIRKAMGAQGIWKHVEGTAFKPKQYDLLGSTYVLPDGATPVTEDQVETRESKVEEYERKQYLAQHIILSTTATCIGAKIKNMSTAKDMWEEVKKDATTKSTLFIIDAEDQLTSMRCNESTDPKNHLSEIKTHFKLMTRRRDNLTNIGSTLSDTRFSTMIMSSLPSSYRPALQTITAASKANKTVIVPADLITFFIEEAEHRVIERGRATADAALVACSGGKSGRPGKPRNGANKPTNVVCENSNCGKSGHTKANCWVKGGGKEGQGPQTSTSKTVKKTATESAAVADDGDLFAFSCTLDFKKAADDLVSSK